MCEISACLVFLAMYVTRCDVRFNTPLYVFSRYICRYLSVYLDFEYIYIELMRTCASFRVTTCLQSFAQTRIVFKAKCKKIGLGSEVNKGC